MSRLADGDRSAFEPLYEALRPRAVRLARQRIGDAEADDVAQAALLKVFSRASDFTPGRACLPWFYAIVVNEIHAARRRNARLVLEESASAGQPADELSAEEQLVRHELTEALGASIRNLDDDAAEAIRGVLGRHIEPQPRAPSATMRKRVSRAYAKLRLLLGNDHAR
jgi:RNA polymerase sigma factor (sigma-70 family)